MLMYCILSVFSQNCYLVLFVKDCKGTKILSNNQNSCSKLKDKAKMFYICITEPQTNNTHESESRL